MFRTWRVQRWVHPFQTSQKVTLHIALYHLLFPLLNDATKRTPRTMQSNAYTRAAARAHTLAGSSFPSDGSEWFANLVYLIKQHDGLSILLSISCLPPPPKPIHRSVSISPDSKLLTFKLPDDMHVLAGTLPSCVKVKEPIVQPDGTAAILDKS